MKKIFITSAIIFALVTCAFFIKGKSVANDLNTRLKVALNTTVPLEMLDTREILDSSDYSVLELFLSTLVEYNNQGEIVGGLADRFYWDDNKLIFEFRNATFSSGKKVTPEDAIASFKRLMILNQNTHGDLVNLLCMDQKPQSLSDKCEGLKADGNRLILTAKKQTPFLLPLLTSIEYGILAQETIDNPELKITSFEDTSGPYRLVKNGAKSHLEANKNHWHYRPRMPQVVEFVNFDYDPKSPKSSENLFINGEVELIPTASELRLSGSERLKAKFTQDFSTHATNPISLAYAEYTAVGLKLPVEKRRHIFACMRRAIQRNMKNDPEGRISTLQILPPSSEGNLSLEQTTLIENEFEKHSEPCDALGIRIAVPEFLKGFYQRVLEAEINNFTLIGFPDIMKFGDRTDEDVPEMTILGVDVASIEDINFISFSVKAGILTPPNNRTPADWLKQYFQNPDKPERLSMLQKMQFYTVWEDPRIVPFTLRPFVSVIHGRWKTDFSKLFANDPFWRIELK